jgi:hypothetical protein
MPRVKGKTPGSSLADRFKTDASYTLRTGIPEAVKTRSRFNRTPLLAKYVRSHMTGGAKNYSPKE